MAASAAAPTTTETLRMCPSSRRDLHRASEGRRVVCAERAERGSGEARSQTVYGSQLRFTVTLPLSASSTSAAEGNGGCCCCWTWPLLHVSLPALRPPFAYRRDAPRRFMRWAECAHYTRNLGGSAWASSNYALALHFFQGTRLPARFAALRSVYRTLRLSLGLPRLVAARVMRYLAQNDDEAEWGLRRKADSGDAWDFDLPLMICAAAYDDGTGARGMPHNVRAAPVEVRVCIADRDEVLVRLPVVARTSTLEEPRCTMSVRWCYHDDDNDDVLRKSASTTSATLPRTAVVPRLTTFTHAPERRVLWRTAFQRDAPGARFFDMVSYPNFKAIAASHLMFRVYVERLRDAGRGYATSATTTTWVGVPAQDVSQHPIPFTHVQLRRNEQNAVGITVTTTITVCAASSALATMPGDDDGAWHVLPLQPTTAALPTVACPAERGAVLRIEPSTHDRRDYLRFFVSDDWRTAQTDANTLCVGLEAFYWSYAAMPC